MTEPLLFPSRDALRVWLIDNGASSDGVWLTFGKKGGPKTLSAEEALLEALCFGWIDGQFNSIDDTVYLKYFAPRRKGSVWSEKNRGLVAQLDAQGLMTEAGRAAIEAAKKTGTWHTPKPQPITEDQIAALTGLLSDHELAYSNFLNMSPSVQRNYAGLYFDAKSEEAKARRLDKIIGRLNENKKPSEPVAKNLTSMID